MNGELFTQAMDLLDDCYILEAAEKRGGAARPLRRTFRRIAACAAALLLVAALSFGAALAASPALRQSVAAFLFPHYGESELQEIEEGHRTGSFSLEDTLFTFLEYFNSQDLGTGIAVKKEEGFLCEFLTDDGNSASVLAACTSPDWRLLVTMERVPYEETAGLWQVTAWQLLPAGEAEALLRDSR